MRSLTASLVLTSALSAACAQQEPIDNTEPPKVQVDSIDVHDIVGDGLILGVSHVAGAPGQLDLIVPDRGIVRVDRQGTLVSEHRVGEQGLQARAYSDVASLENDQFVLLSDSEGYLYDPATGALSVHFCVEPGFEEPVVIQRNDALATSGNLILAAPRFYTFDGMGEEVLTESALRTYRADDGTPLSSVDLTSEGLELKGIAQAGDEILGVQAGELVRFSLDGELLSRAELKGVIEASGIAVDLSVSELVIADAETDILSIFEL